MVMVSFKDPHRSITTEDLSYVLFDGQHASLSQCDMATNAKKVVDVALGGTVNGDRALILYQGSTKKVHRQCTCNTSTSQEDPKAWLQSLTAQLVSFHRSTWHFFAQIASG